MSVSLKEIFNEHKWLWGAAALLVFAAGALSAIWLNARDAEHINVPVMEAAITEEASRKISESITEAQQRKNKLPEVVKNAKNNVMRDVADTDDACIADRWNGILWRYRESRTPAGGI